MPLSARLPYRPKRPERDRSQEVARRTNNNDPLLGKWRLHLQGAATHNARTATHTHTSRDARATSPVLQVTLSSLGPPIVVGMRKGNRRHNPKWRYERICNPIRRAQADLVNDIPNLLVWLHQAGHLTAMVCPPTVSRYSSRCSSTPNNCRTTCSLKTTEAHPT